MDFSLRPGMLVAAQYICCPLSSFETRICSIDVVFTKALSVSVVYVELLVMFFDALYQVILACGSQNDVVQVRFIFCSAITVSDVDVNDTDVTGTV